MVAQSLSTPSKTRPGKGRFVVGFGLEVAQSTLSSPRSEPAAPWYCQKTGRFFYTRRFSLQTYGEKPSRFQRFSTLPERFAGCPLQRARIDARREGWLWLALRCEGWLWLALRCFLGLNLSLRQRVVDANPKRLPFPWPAFYTWKPTFPDSAPRLCRVPSPFATDSQHVSYPS